jgi:hypothetical protein
MPVLPATIAPFSSAPSLSPRASAAANGELPVIAARQAEPGLTAMRCFGNLTPSQADALEQTLASIDAGNIEFDGISYYDYRLRLEDAIRRRPGASPSLTGEHRSVPSTRAADASRSASRSTGTDDPHEYEAYLARRCVPGRTTTPAPTNPYPSGSIEGIIWDNTPKLPDVDPCQGYRPAYSHGAGAAGGDHA